jgi:excisionase family DNA binding protein
MSTSYSVDEFAEAEGVSRATIYNLWQRGEGPRYYLVGKQRRITEEMRRAWQLDREAKTFKEAADASAS